MTVITNDYRAIEEVKILLNKKVKIFIGICVLSIIFIFMGYFFRVDRFGMSQIDWVDCVQINNIKYHSDFNRTSAEYSLIDKKIGEVKFNVYKNVHNGNYRFRDGDATFLDVGTEIYSLKSDNNAITVKIGEIYFLYKIYSKLT